MTRKELLEALREIRHDLTAPPSERYSALLPITEIMTRLEGEPEPIWEGAAEIHDVRGERCQADAGAIVFRRAGIKEGQRLRLLAWLEVPE